MSGIRERRLKYMFGIFTGVVINALLVVIGSAAGSLMRKEMFRRAGERIFELFGVFVIVMGVSGASGIDRPLFVLLCIVAGVAAGEFIDLHGRFARLAGRIESRFAGKSGGDFSSGFVSGSLLFCVGSMTIMGALESGLQGSHDIYITKSVIDCVSAAVFAMGAGAGVGLAAAAVLIYQGALVALASLLKPVMTPETVALSAAVGSLCLVALGMDMLGIKKLKTANFLPAMFVPVLCRAAAVLLGIEGVL